MKSKYFFMFMSALLFLTACNDTTADDEASENDSNEMQGENDETLDDSSNGSSDESLPEPPGLTVRAGEETFSGVLGTYSWSVDNEDGTMTAIEVDSAAPPELVRTTDPVEVTPETPIDLDFEEEPFNYTVRIWDEDNTILSESDELVLSGEGEVIYEILAYWEQGTASYAFSLVIE